jgi:hypothetical protein
MAWLDRWEQPVAKRNALTNATPYHRDMPDGPHRIDWEWEEIVLACDLVAQNGWRQLDAGDPRVRELSGLLQRMSMHPSKLGCQAERKPALREKKIRSVQARGDVLTCEACGLIFYRSSNRAFNGMMAAAI